MLYRDKVCSLVNNPTDPGQATYLDGPWPPTAEEPEFTIQEDPEFPVIDLARAIKDVIRGEEDRDPDVLRRGAKILRDMEDKYQPSEHMVLDAPIDNRFRHAESTNDKPMPGIRFASGKRGFNFGSLLDLILLEGIPLRDVLEVDPDADLPTPPREPIPSGFESESLFTQFRRYLTHDHQLLTLGVCHDEFCERLYVKSKHASTRQLYCSDNCRQRAHRSFKRETSSSA